VPKIKLRAARRANGSTIDDREHGARSGQLGSEICPKMLQLYSARIDHIDFFAL